MTLVVVLSIKNEKQRFDGINGGGCNPMADRCKGAAEVDARLWRTCDIHGCNRRCIHFCQWVTLQVSRFEANQLLLLLFEPLTSRIKSFLPSPSLSSFGTAPIFKAENNHGDRRLYVL